MTETQTNKSPEERLHFIHNQLTNLFTPLPEQDQEGHTRTHDGTSIDFSETDMALARREICSEDIANALIDPEIGSAVAELIIKKREESETKSPTDLYVYSEIIKKITDKNPDAIIPKSFLDMVGELVVEAADEVNIMLKATTLASKMLGTHTVSTDQATKLQSAPQETKEKELTLQEVIDLSQSELANLSEKYKSELGKSTSDLHLAEMDLLESYSTNSFVLDRLLSQGGFRTPEGQRAAAALLDTALLETYWDEPHKAHEDLNSGKLKTEEGKRAAAALMDTILIDEYSDEPSHLEILLEFDKIRTPEGKRAAENILSRYRGR